LRELTNYVADAPNGLRGLAARASASFDKSAVWGAISLCGLTEKYTFATNHWPLSRDQLPSEHHLPDRHWPAPKHLPRAGAPLNHGSMAIKFNQPVRRAAREAVPRTSRRGR